MPIYVYTCTVCAHQFEKIQKMHSGSITACPECGQDAEREIATPGRFKWGKGGGWT